MELFFIGLSAVFLVSILSLIGVFSLSLSPQLLNRFLPVIVAVAGGALLGNAFLHLIPEAFHAENEYVGIVVLLGILTFFLLEKALRFHHCHTQHGKETAHIHPVGPLVLISDGLHNLIDGIAIGIAFSVSLELGIATTLAIALHELPQEIGDFALLVHAGFSRLRALFLNFCSALFAVIGFLLSFWIGETHEFLVPFLLAFAAGNFIYIALADIVPEITKENGTKSALFQSGGIIVGILLMLFVSFMFADAHSHAHEDTHAEKHEEEVHVTQEENHKESHDSH